MDPLKAFLEKAKLNLISANERKIEMMGNIDTENYVNDIAIFIGIVTMQNKLIEEYKQMIQQHIEETRKIIQTEGKQP